MSPVSVSLYIGTSGWSYPWQNILYPPGLRSGDYLKHYATHFNCTEINSSFYHFTMPKTIEKWLSETPASFLFAPKMHQEITHERKFVDVEEPLEKFMSRYLLMGNRLGPILIQIAASFHFNAQVAAPFFQMLRSKYPDQAFAFEARHVSWFTEPALELLRAYEITFVIASSGGRFPGLETTTSTDTVYLRLHGDTKLYDSNYSLANLEHYAQLTQHWLQAGKAVWIFFNNTMRGQAVADIDKLKQILGELIKVDAG